jgi:hypothetical protein
VHPPLSGRNEKPDFLVARQDGRKTAYLEVISFSPTSEEQKQKNRDAVIYSAIDKVHLPPRCGLGLNFRAHGIRQPSLKRLRSEIEAWAAECVTGENKSQFVRTFSFGDWEVELTLLTQLRREGHLLHHGRPSSRFTLIADGLKRCDQSAHFLDNRPKFGKIPCKKPVVRQLRDRVPRQSCRCRLRSSDRRPCRRPP